MSIERARAHLARHGLEDRIRELEVSSATVALAAQALGCEPERIAKTLSFHVGERVALILFAGDVRIDNRKFKDQFHTKAKMLAALLFTLARVCRKSFDYVKVHQRLTAKEVNLKIVP